MRYNFKDILNGEIYESTRVMFVLGKYSWFNNTVCDALKSLCIDEETSNPIVMGIGDEFGVSDDTDEDFLSNSVDFNTFMEVIGVASINGRWFCKTDLSTLNKKQKETLLKYIKDPSPNGILVIVSSEWRDYKDWLKNRALGFSKSCHIMQLNYPNRQVLKSLVHQYFNYLDSDIDNGGLDFFIMRMSSAYDDYTEQIERICEMHQAEQEKAIKNGDSNNNKKDKKPERDVITAKDLKVYMKGIENFIVDDYINELMKPVSSDKTNSKKVLKMMIALEEEKGAKNLVYELLNKIEEYIDFRILINSGYIPIGINYFFNEVIDMLPDKEKYEKMNEWQFRRKASIAAQTSLRDWEYMRIILLKAVENNRLSEEILDAKCQKALYEISTRSVLTPDRINNITGFTNILKKEVNDINKIIFDETALAKIQSDVLLANAD